MSKNTSIEKVPQIKNDHIDNNKYTLSLMDAAYSLKIFTSSNIENIQMQVMDTLSTRIMDYTRGESSSVKTETAQNLLLSIIYCVDAYLMSLDDPDSSILILQTKGISEIYKRGIALVKNYVIETLALYDAIKSNKLDVELIAYNDTIDAGIDEFFKKYNVEFNAHDTMASIDYPVAFDNMSVSGILYIKQYLEKLKIENEFCSIFAKNDIDKILECYGKINNANYRDLLINIFEIVLQNSIFSVLIWKSAKNLSISMVECELLYQKLKSLSQEDCSNTVKEAIDQVIHELDIASPTAQAYIRQFQDLLVPRLIKSVDKNTLQNLVITLQKEIPHSEIVFEEGTKMDDDSFRSVVNRILECTTATEKAGIIISAANCLEDFVDILDAYCLFDDEFTTVFDLLGDTELAMLVGKVFEEELRMAPVKLSIKDLNISPKEREWQNQFILYLKGINANRIAIICEITNDHFRI